MFENIVILFIPEGKNNIFYKSINSGFNKKSYTDINSEKLKEYICTSSKRK